MTSAWFFAADLTIAGPPISIISISSCSLAGGSRAAVSSKGYRFTHTMSIDPYPISTSFSISCFESRLASIPPWTAGCRVLTLPSNISGWPVASDTSITSIPESLSLVAVPPVDRIAQPMDCNDAASSSIPVLSQTLISAVGRSMGIRV